MKQSTLDPIILSDLCSQLIAHLESIHMMPRTIDNYKVVLRKMQLFAEERDKGLYCEELINDFIHENGFQERASDPGHMYYRTCRMLHDLARGSIPRHYYSRHNTTIPLPAPWNASIEEYKSFLNSKHQSLSTIKTKLSRLKDFFLFLMRTDILTPAKLHPAVITDFIRYASQTYKPIYRYNLLQSLKDFLSFLYSSSLVSDNYALLLSSLPDPRNSVLPTSYSPEEIRLILGSVDRNTLMGKRDFAVIQMIAQTGIRAIDIANLKLEDICPSSREIQFLQNKTKKRLHLPLTDEMCFSLYDYLSSRVDYQCPCLFIRITDARVAFPVTSSCISAITKKYIRLSGVYSPDKKAGSHSLRHSLAVSMTDAGTPFPVVSKVLGHSSTEVTKKYAGISLNQLRILALEVPVYER